MSSTQVHLIMIAAAIGAWGVFALPAPYGSRSRTARHALAAIAALVCMAAPFLAWQGPEASPPAVHLRRAAAIATLGLCALALWLTLVARRPPAEVVGAGAVPTLPSDTAAAPRASPAADPILAAIRDPVPGPISVPALDAVADPIAAAVPGTGVPAPPDRIEAPAGLDALADLDLADTELRREMRDRAPSVVLPEGDAWRTITVDAAGDASLDRGAPATPAIVPATLAGAPPAAPRGAAGIEEEGRAGSGSETRADAPSEAPDAGTGAPEDVSDAEIVAEIDLATLPEAGTPSVGVPAPTDTVVTELESIVERERLRAERAEAACEGLSAARVRAETRAKEAARLARDAERARDALAAGLERERETLRVQRTATARAVRIAREAIAALAARERADGS